MQQSSTRPFQSLLVRIAAIVLAVIALAALNTYLEWRRGRVVEAEAAWVQRLALSRAQVLEALSAADQLSRVQDSALRETIRDELDSLFAATGRTLTALEADTSRSGRLLKRPEVSAAVEHLLEQWRNEVAPALSQAAASGSPAESGSLVARLDDAGPAFVLAVDAATEVGQASVADRLRRFVAAATAVRLGIAISALLGFVVAWRAVRRLSSLAEITRRVADGDFDARMPEAGELEFVALAQSFNQMTTQLRALLEREQRFFQLSDGLLCVAGYDGYFKRLNPAWEKTLGYSVGELLARPWLDFVHPDDRAKTIAEGERLVKKGLETVNFENRYVAMDGSMRCLRWNVVPSPTEQVLYCVVTDVTSLRETEERLELALNATSEGLWDWNVQTGDVYYSDRWITALGYTRPEVRAHVSFREHIIHPEDRPRVRAALETHLAGSTPLYEATARFRMKSGEWRWTSDRGKVVARDQEGRPLRMVGTDTDITERRRLEEQLRQAQKLESMGQLTGGIAHDFNNLLTVVLANAELIASTPPGRSSEVRGILSELMEATRSGATLIRQLLGFSRRAELRPLALDLNDTIRLTNGMLRRVLPESITITERLTAVPPVSADKAALQQIFLNLATNARDAMPSGGTFTLETGVVDIGEDYVVTHPWVTTGTYVCVSCSDSGHGMDPATVERVFDPFFTTKDPGRGTGLGMPMVYGLMKQHGGFVHVYSELGHGTTVKLYFPISAASTGGPSSVSEPTDDVPRGRGETILVVEDQEALRRTIVRVLTKLGYRVLEANGTNAGLRMYDEHRHEVALVLSDLVMAGPSGRMLYERLKAEKPAPKFILTSGYTAGDIEERAKIGTDVPFLAKPWSVAEVAQLVRRVLDDS